MMRNCKKQVFAIRHGESEWNVLHRMFPSDKDRYHPRMWKIDCDITQNGVLQANAAGVRLAEMVPESVDLLLVSPLRRALQTAHGILQSYSGNVVKTEVCLNSREVLVDPCDIGSTPESLSKEFPVFDFSHLDTYWWHGGLSPLDTLNCMKERKGLEDDASVETRIQALKESIRERPEQTIVVVCHSDTIWWLTRHTKRDGQPLGTRAANGEIVDITASVLGFEGEDPNSFAAVQRSCTNY